MMISPSPVYMKYLSVLPLAVGSDENCSDSTHKVIRYFERVSNRN